MVNKKSIISVNDSFFVEVATLEKLSFKSVGIRLHLEMLFSLLTVSTLLGIYVLMASRKYRYIL